MPLNPAPDHVLIDRLRAVAGRPQTHAEIVAQRVSYVYGNLPNDSTITRHQVQEAIAKMNGERTPA